MFFNVVVAAPLHAVELKGSLTQGGLILTKVAPGSKVLLNGEPVTVSKQGDVVFGFGRDAELEHELVVITEGTKQQIPIKLEKREYQIQRIEGIPKKIMQPDEESLKRIRSEGALVKAARGQLLELEYFKQDFHWPLKGEITGVYGSQRFFNGEPKRPHFGLDIAAPVGTLVVAPNDGVVTLAHDDMFYSGGTLIMDHGYGISSTFIHLNKILVKEGQKVKRGEVVAEVGASGRATGPHLDWRINWFQERLDPALVVGPMQLEK